MVSRIRSPFACPFCRIMLEDARGSAGSENLVIRDIAEIVADGLVESGR
jgi:Fe-S oxidoreductase